MLIKKAKEITGGLTHTSKMPGPSYNTPASRCITGAKLRKVPGSVCSSCYALKGNYKRFPKVEEALEKRFKSLKRQAWVPAMVALITGHKYFRWHDSGDLQGPQHLKNIFEVCKATPGTQHWLPTREAGLMKFIDPDVIPKNLIIRISATKVDGLAPRWWPWTSTVSTEMKTCPAPDQGGKCRDCRSCWSRDIQNVTYAKH